MKKYIIGLSILIILMLASFSINLNPIVIENYYNPSEELVTVDEAPESFSPATTTPSATTTLMNNDKRDELSYQNFRFAYEKNLKEPITLSDFEKELTAYLYELWKWKGSKWTPENENFYELKVNGLSCYRIWSGMGYAWLDEIHPSQGYPQQERTFAIERYMCYKESIFDSQTSLFGAPFFYNNAWWIYQDNEDIRSFWDNVWNDCKSPCATYVQNLATRVQIDLDDEIYSVVLPSK